MARPFTRRAQRFQTDHNVARSKLKLEPNRKLDLPLAEDAVSGPGRSVEQRVEVQTRSGVRTTGNICHDRIQPCIHVRKIRPIEYIEPLCEKFEVHSFCKLDPSRDSKIDIKEGWRPKRIYRQIWHPVKTASA